jgi:hypothetical protein
LFADNDKAIFGAGSDLQIYHSGSASIIEDQGTGDLVIKGTDLYLRNSSNSNRLYAGTDVRLYYNAVEKIRTTSTGIDVTGVITTDGLALGDGQKATFGAGDDLRVYHSSSQSYIEDAGAGNLNFKSNGLGFDFKDGSDNLVFQIDLDSETTLYHNTSSKLTTTSTGIDVTGTATMDGLTVDGVAKVLGAAGNTIVIADAAETNGYQLKANTSASADFGFLIENLAGKDLLKVESNNDISFYDDTGTSQALFWDASAESLGIGTTSPSSTLEISKSDQTNGATLSITNSFDGADWNAGDTVGTINFRVDDGSATEKIRGQIKVFDDTSSSTTYPAYNAMSFSTGSLNTLHERMRIDSSGNVGIGTDSPNAKLDVSSAATGSATITPTELLISSSTSASDWSLTDPWGVLGFYSADASGGGAGNLAEISANMESNVGGLASLDFKLRNSGQSYAKTSWLTLKNSGSLAGRQVIIEADGGLYVENNVGIKTINPDDGDLQIGETNTAFNIALAGPRAKFGYDGNNAIVQGGTAKGIAFCVNNGTLASGEAARFTGTGTLLVGKIANSIDTVGGLIRDNGQIGGCVDGDYVGVFNRKTSDGNIVLFRKDTATVGSIATTSGAINLYGGSGTNGITVDSSGNLTATGNVTAYSDERLKDNIQTLQGSKVLEMRGVSYTKDGEASSGVIAQEIEKVAPELVHTAKDEMGTKSVAYGNLVGYLIEAIKEQQQQIDELKARLDNDSSN